MNRLDVHAKVDEIFDGLDKLSKSSAMKLERLMLEEYDQDDSITGCVLVKRQTGLPNRKHVTWGVSPYNAGLHSGHYDLTQQEAEEDWTHRATRGW